MDENDRHDETTAQPEAKLGIKLPQATKDKWLAALESGNYEQCQSHLYDGQGYCCLGVLGKADGNSFVPRYADEDWDEEDEQPEAEIVAWDLQPPGGGHDLNNDDLLDDLYAASLGLTDDHQTLLSSLNDGSISTTVPNNELLFPVWKALADKGGKVRAELLATHDVHPYEVWKFSAEKHTFAEIAAVIREHL